uniref:Signal recognition particle subunit SRP68 n=1 Tax=Rhabditophanes sp. KR3021 TaxID=114890 RepID=A0AC35TXY2_9BILA
MVVINENEPQMEVGKESDTLAMFETFSILKNVKTAQQKHGLRHDNFERYRVYCGERVRRIRKKLNFTNGYKSVKKIKSKWIPKDVTLEKVDKLDWLELVMFEVERDWAYANAIKHDISTSGAKSDGLDSKMPRKKHHMKRKLKNAVYHGESLDKLVRNSDRCDAVTKLEVQAYSEYMKGFFNIEMEDWAVALGSFTKVKTIYEKLSSVVKWPDMIQLYGQRCNEVLPHIRFCKYQLGDTADAVSDMKKLNLEGKNQAGGDFERLISQLEIDSVGKKDASVTWAGITTPITDAKLKKVVAASHEFSGKTDISLPIEEKLKAYEGFLQDIRDELIKLLDERKKLPPSTAEDLSNPLVIASHFLEFQKFKVSSDRYLDMIASMKTGEKAKTVKPQDFLRLYGSVIDNYKEITEIKGAENEKGLIEAFEFKSEFWQAFKSFYMAQVYVLYGKVEEAEALLNRVEERIQKLNVVMDERRNISHVTEKKEDLVELMKLVQESKATFKASCFASTLDTSSIFSAPNPSGYVSENVDSFYFFNKEDLQKAAEDDSCLPLIPSKINMLPMPAKPMFFDLAGSHIKVDERLKKKYPDVFKN